jgi:hypothetical protein
MELSDRTLQVLKNYATINPNIVFKKGNELMTISVARNVLSKATLDEEIPSDFGIYDLNEFLNVLGLVDSPNLELTNDYAIVSDSVGRTKIKYHFSDPDMLTVPQKEIIMPETEVNFVLDTATLSKLKRAASALGHGEISISPSGGSVRLSVVDTTDPTSNTLSIDVEGDYDEGTTFNFILNVNNLKIVNEDFEVGISSKLISNFKSQQSAIEYFIALEKTSTYGV